MSEILERPMLTPTMRTTAIMGEEGHVSFGWDQQNDEWVQNWIQQKMDAGFVFWIVRRNPLREVQLNRVADINDDRHLVIRDDGARQLFVDGRLHVLDDDGAEGDEPVEPLRRARSAREAAQHDTVAHRALRGG